MSTYHGVYGTAFADSIRPLTAPWSRTRYRGGVVQKLRRLHHVTHATDAKQKPGRTHCSKTTHITGLSRSGYVKGTYMANEFGGLQFN